MTVSEKEIRGEISALLSPGGLLAFSSVHVVVVVVRGRPNHRRVLLLACLVLTVFEREMPATGRPF